MIELIEVNSEYIEEIEAFRQEVLSFDTDNVDRFAGCMSLDKLSAAEWVHVCELRKDPKTCREAGVDVPSTSYLAVHTTDDRVVGIIDLRHHIDHPILGTWGGHCGYTVRPSERRKGYAKEMLRLNIQNALSKGIHKMLVTCQESNPASEKAILINGGVYEKTIDVDGTLIKRFWIDTDSGI